MKKYYLFLFLIILNSTAYSQNRLKMVVDLSDTYSSRLEGDKGIPTMNFNLQIGMKYVLNRGDFFTKFLYQYSGNFEFKKTGISKNFISKNFILRSNFLGISFGFVFLSHSCRFRPYLESTISTEIQTNYKNGYLRHLGLFSIGNIAHKPYVNLSSFSHLSTYKLVEYSSSFYISTLLVGSLITGCETRLAKNLILKVGIGYSFRRVQSKYARWSGGSKDNPPLNYAATLVSDISESEIEEMLKNVSSTYRFYHMLDVTIGLNYTIPFKKKEKVKPVE